MLAMESCLHLVFYGKLIKLGQTVAGVVRIDPSTPRCRQKNQTFQRDISLGYVYFSLFISKCKFELSSCCHPAGRLKNIRNMERTVEDTGRDLHP